MGKIFSSASITIIWLGPEKVESNLAMKLLNMGQEVWTDDEAEQRFVAKADSMPKHWAALRKLLTRPWFSRRWIIQEVALSGHKTVVCGNSVVCWNVIRNIVPLDPLNRELVTRDDSVLQLEALHHISHVVEQQQEEMLTFEALLTTFSQSLSSDPKDVVYSLLSLASDVQSGDNWQPDYSPETSITDVFIMAFRHIVAKSQGLDIICRGTFKIRWHGSTWLPSFGYCHGPCDFGSECINHGYQTGTFATFAQVHLPPKMKVYSASGGASPSFEISLEPCPSCTSCDYKRLINTGHIVDTVSKIGCHMSDGPWNTGTCRVPDQWIHIACGYDPDICRDAGVCTSHHCSADHVPDAFWRSLVGNRSFRADVGRGIEDTELSAVLLERSVPSAWYSIMSDVLLNGNIRELETERLSEWWRIFRSVTACVNEGTRFARTEHLGYCALLSALTESGDVICIIMGGSVPVVLRPCGGMYHLIGDCYIDGIMDGE